VTVSHTLHDKRQVDHLFSFQLGKEGQFYIEDLLWDVVDEFEVLLSIPKLEENDSERLSLKNVDLVVVKQIFQHLLAVLNHEIRSQLDQKSHDGLR